MRKYYSKVIGRGHWGGGVLFDKSGGFIDWILLDLMGRSFPFLFGKWNAYHQIGGGFGVAIVNFKMEHRNITSQPLVSRIAMRIGSLAQRKAHLAGGKILLGNQPGSETTWRKSGFSSSGLLINGYKVILHSYSGWDLFDSLEMKENISEWVLPHGSFELLRIIFIQRSQLLIFFLRIASAKQSTCIFSLLRNRFQVLDFIFFQI